MPWLYRSTRHQTPAVRPHTEATEKNRPTGAWRNYLTGDMGKGDEVAPRIRFGRRAELPLCALGGYIASGVLLCAGSLQQIESWLRGPTMICAVLAFLAGALVHVFDKIDRKIDESVGPVWDAGEQAGKRHAYLEAEAPTTELAIVHDMAPRR